jgi:hypothetical protein
MAQILHAHARKSNVAPRLLSRCVRGPCQSDVNIRLLAAEAIAARRRDSECAQSLSRLVSTPGAR